MMYWITTIIITGFLLLSSYTYFFSKSTIDGVRELGFPDFFRIELAVLKILAALILLIPGIPLMIKEWGYVGVGLFLLTALIAHIAHKDSWTISVLLVVLFSLLAASYYSMHKVLN